MQTLKEIKEYKITICYTFILKVGGRITEGHMELRGLRACAFWSNRAGMHRCAERHSLKVVPLQR